ncbi:hypothetical protein RF11_09383 [Thelohanellus kitauei]|uniref:Uncharacterized protein n=1 Tax=Thelohanellus kitauei TaxID=669202 RepID=A0A0C2MK92_THEKT|nr:hypothetical protein RF11_09383 [Thelohanellus kitauei]
MEIVINTPELHILYMLGWTVCLVLKQGMDMTRKNCRNKKKVKGPSLGFLPEFQCQRKRFTKSMELAHIYVSTSFQWLNRSYGAVLRGLALIHAGQKNSKITTEVADNLACSFQIPSRVIALSFRISLSRNFGINIPASVLCQRTVIVFKTDIWLEEIAVDTDIKSSVTYSMFSLNSPEHFWQNYEHLHLLKFSTLLIRLSHLKGDSDTLRNNFV